ncbi:MAG: hypothetical protein IJA45_05000 [Oscillospiraceae bacterium]|nr:hypothetical protein [Oscillospiraceae bacterium]
MLSVNLYGLCSDETDKIIKGISEATQNIVAYRKAPNRNPDMLMELADDLRAVCYFWTGSTYVGSPKAEPIKMAFQAFFEEFMQLLLLMKDSTLPFEKRVAIAMLYSGTVYRYLGKNYPSDEVVVPYYDGIYVSWSKQDGNSFLLSKFYGPVTKITCEIAEPMYGIDLDILECTRGNEQEVVFPTFEQSIVEILYSK